LWQWRCCQCGARTERDGDRSSWIDDGAGILTPVLVDGVEWQVSHGLCPGCAKAMMAEARGTPVGTGGE